MAIPKGGNMNPPKHHHHHPPTQHPGGHIPYNPPGSNDPVVVTGSPGHYQTHPVAWVVRRQQILRRAGFNVAVDGIYGPQTTHAWAQFIRGISSTSASNLHQFQHFAGQAIPPGYVRYQGRILPKAQATILHAISRVQATPSSFDGGRAREAAAQAAKIKARNAENARLEASIARNPALRAAASAHGGRGADLVAITQRRHRQIQAIDRRATQQQAVDQAKLDAKNELDRIIGVDGKLIRLDPDYLVKAAKYGRITAHDIGVLIRNGLLDDTDPGDVKTIQYTINHELPNHKVKVDGVYGATTNAALERLRERAARQEYNRQVAETKDTLYKTGVAQIASQEVLGKVVDAEHLIAILQAGGPKAARLVQSLGHYYQDWQGRANVQELQLQKAQEMLGGTDAKLDQDAVFRVLTGPSATKATRALAFAHDMNEFQGSLDVMYAAKLAKYRKEQLAQQAIDKFKMSGNGQPGFFSEMWDAYYNDTPLDNVVDAAGAVYGPVKHNFQRLVITGFDQYSHYIDLGHLNPLNPPDGAESIGQSWEQSEATLSELKHAGGLNALLFDLIVDPVNFVPGAWFAKGFGLAGKGVAEGIAHGSEGFSRSLEFVDRWASHSKLTDDLVVSSYRSHVFAQDVHLLGLRAALKEGDRFGALYATEEALKRNRIYRMATTLRSEGIRKVHDTMLNLVVTGLRDVAFDRLSTVGAVDVELAAHAEEFHAIRGLALNDYRVQHNLSTVQQEEAFRRAAPELSASIDAIKSPMFRRTVGYMSSKLTFAGTRVRAHILEGTRQAIISRYRLLDDFAKHGNPDELPGLSRLTTQDLRDRHLAQFGPEMNAAALSDAGTWFIGGLPHDLYEGMMQEINLMRERVLKQILPQFDDMILPRLDNVELGVVVRDGEVLLLNEASDTVRRSLDEFMGYNVDDAYLEKNWVETKNPNYGHDVTFTAKQRYSLDEAWRRKSAVETYAELHVSMGDQSRDWAAWVEQRNAEIDADIKLAWDLKPGGERWIDNREFVKAPKPTILAAEQKTGPVANQMATMIDAFLSFDRAPRTTFLKRIHQGRTNEVLDMLEAKGVMLGDWEQYTDAGQRIEAIQALVESEALPKAYMSESLYWYGLREHQARRYRAIYYATVGALGLWKTATLPLRPAFVVRNVVDNWSKMMLEGYRDPRLFYAMGADAGKSIFQMTAFGPMRGLARFVDRLSGTNVYDRIREIEGEFWLQHPSTLEKIMEAEGIPHDSSLFRRTMGEEEMSNPEDYRGPFERITQKDYNRVDAEGVPVKPEDATYKTLNRKGAGSDVTRIITRQDLNPDHWIMRWRDAFWEMAVATPEGYMSKQLYASKFLEGKYKADEQFLRDGDEFARAANMRKAQKDAIETVSKTLFDYDNVSILEENLKVFFPFIFFWRSNAQFWAKQAIAKPWFFYKADQVYEAHLESNIDQPEWMRRYVDLSPIGNTLHALPWVGPWLSSGVSIDPLNYISIAAFYRAFKNGNQDLPADQQGMAFISNLVDGFNADFGLSINPFMRFLGERFGILNYRTWQDIFPQTSLLTALSNTDFFRSLLPGIGPAGFDIEHWLGDKIFHDMLGGASTQEMTIQNFNYYVQREMAAQVARGETPNRAAAEAKIRGYIAFQTIVGYSIGTFPRRMTPDDIAIDKMAEAIHQIYADSTTSDAEKSAAYQSFMASQSEDMRAAYQLYSKNKAQDRVGAYNPAAFDRWAIGAKAAQAFFALDDPAEQDAFLAAHPEILPIVNPIIDDRVPSATYIRDLTLISDTQAAVDFGYTYLDDIKADYKTQKAAEAVLVSPEMRSFWAENDTAGEVRARQIAGSYFHYISRLNNTYFAIPDNHYAARSEYLSKHPELADWWARNDSASDDYRAIQLAANSTFREIYFKMVDAGDWDAADIFLKRHSYMFDYTSAEGRITPDGNWLPRSQAQKDYAGVAEDLKTYYSYGGSAAGESYLLGHPNVRRFLTKYKGVGGMQDYAADYDKMKSVNDTYFSLPDAQKAAFLAQHPELKAYWNKYAHERSDSQHARDYQAVKPLLDAFFDLEDSQKSAYLATHPTLQAYFDKYGSHKTHGTIRTHIAADPEIKQRYDFWQHYFALPPNKRAQFVYTHAAQAGIFIYGSLAGNWRHDIAAEWARKSIRFGTSKRAAAYMSIKPLMDMYFGLKSDGEKALFLQTNPELQVYFEMFGDPFTNDPKMNKLLKQYFRLPGFSSQRADFINAHPEIRAFFNKDASPKEAAIQRMADAYFSLPFNKRQEYVYRHPELQAYFDQRTHEQDLFTSLTAAFNETDPRMKQFYEMYSDIIPKDAIHRYFLQVKKMANLAASRDDTGRTPQKADETLRRVVRNPVQ